MVIHGLKRARTTLATESGCFCLRQWKLERPFEVSESIWLREFVREPVSEPFEWMDGSNGGIVTGRYLRFAHSSKQLVLKFTNQTRTGFN